MSAVLLGLSSCFDQPGQVAEENQYPDREPQFPGGPDQLADYLERQMNILSEAHPAGEVKVAFTVNTLGRLDDVRVVDGLSERLNEEAIRLISIMPIWEPGAVEGAAVPMEVVLTVPFRENVVPEGSVFKVVEQMPQFPGGNNQLYKYLAGNFHAPENLEDMGVKGRIYVQFVVTKEGKVSQVEVLRGIDHPEILGGSYGTLDQEAVRVVRSMPLWTPGYQRGEPVNTNLIVPFTISSESKK